jgi:hypothetical protein
MIQLLATSRILAGDAGKPTIVATTFAPQRTLSPAGPASDIVKLHIAPKEELKTHKQLL